MTYWIPVLTASIAALTATLGYILTNRVKLIEARQATYAQALLAVATYKALPYLIRRRVDSTPATRAALGTGISNAERDLDYYTALLDLDSPQVAASFRAYAYNARLKGTEFRAEAWRAPPITGDTDMRFTDSWRYRDSEQLAACKSAMKRRLALYRLR